MSQNIDLIQESDPQKLVALHNSIAGPGVQPGVHVFAATTKERGLQTDVVDLRQYVPGLMSSPERGTRVVTDVVSFLAELDRYKLDSSASTLWGDETAGKVVAIYNDHHRAAEPAEAADSADAPDDSDAASTPTSVAGHRDNRLELRLRADEDWAAWHAMSGEYFTQEKFGDLVEELIDTVVSPDQADLLEIINSIRTSSHGSFQSSIRRETGSQSIEYTEETTATAGRASTLEVPREIVLKLRPYEGMETYEVRAYFRLRVVKGQLGLAVKLRNSRAVLRGAWRDVVAEIEAPLGKPVLATQLAKS